MGFWKHLTGYAEADTIALFEHYSWGHLARHILELIAKRTRAFIHAKQVSKPWPWAEYDDSLDRSLENDREETLTHSLAASQRQR